MKNTPHKKCRRKLRVRSLVITKNEYFIYEFSLPRFEPSFYNNADLFIEKIVVEQVDDIIIAMFYGEYADGRQAYENKFLFDTVYVESDDFWEDMLASFCITEKEFRQVSKI